jgi:hypothetical protein
MIPMKRLLNSGEKDSQVVDVSEFVQERGEMIVKCVNDHSRKNAGFRLKNIPGSELFS